MQDVQSLRAVGSAIQERFRIEQLLGRGGFSAVYLVQDEQDENKHYALKELTDTDRQEKNNFAFECEVLKRLNHPALPHVYPVIENDDHACMIMDYIEGPNLEVLRCQQPDKRFPLAQVLTLLSPIVDALSYLHHQEQPILHRDVKPANIIVPTASEKSILVDFGIAKEYNSENTTTALRHCSPGYSAPEQYTTGTDVRTDVYGLAATVYTLLVGTTPVDAMVRATSIAEKSGDPFIPIQDCVPALPNYVAEAIHQALSIGRNERFASVDEFWHALQTPVLKKVFLPRPQVSVVGDVLQQERSTGPIVVSPRTSFLTSKTEIALLAFLALAVILSLTLGISYYKIGLQNSTVTQQQSVSSPAVTPTLDPSYPDIVGPYNGTIHDMATNQKTSMSLTGIAQNNSNVTGYFIGLNNEGKFTGVLDTSRHFLFTVKREGQLSLFFDGVVKQNGDIVGSYCAQDKAGQCAGDYGEWSLRNS